MKEVWKDIDGYNGDYKVSNLGRVKSFKKDKINGIVMKQDNARLGYKRICLCLENVKKNFFIHRLVAKAFIDNPYNKPQVNHKNGKPSDNRVENLEWCTASENHLHSYAVLNKQIPKGESHPYAILSKENVINIRKLYASGGLLQKEIAEYYNIKRRHVCKIVNRQIWNHI